MKYLKNGLLASASILASLPYPSSSFASSAEEILFTQDASTSLPTLSVSNAFADSLDGGIDVVVWVQPAVIDRISATGVNAEQYIDYMLSEWVARSNKAFSDSGITTPLRLVFAGVTENVPDTAPTIDQIGNDEKKQGDHYSEALSTDGTKERIVWLESVPDRTVFLVEKDTASLGFALGMAVIGGNSATVSLLPTTDEEFEKSFKVFIHEIGHTLGGGHEAGAESTRNEPDARAYRCNGGTIMQSVNSAITQLVFSSPNVMIDGQYCGVAGEADNARAMNAFVEAGRTFEQSYVRTGEVSFASTSYSANEADGVATVALERSGDVSGSAVVMLQIFDDSASYPADYPAWQYRVEFEEGQATANVDVTLIADAFEEGDETATLKLAYPAYTNVSAETATLTIIDGIAGNAGELEVDVASTVIEGDDIIITINRVNGSDGELVADVQAFAKTWEDANFAKYVYDYNRYDENVVFAYGETSKTIRIATIDDDVPEYTETLSVLVTSAVNVANADTTVSMLDNENGGAYGMFTMSLVTTGEISDTDGSVELKVSRTGGDAAVTVDLEIVLGNSNAFTLAELDQTSLAFADGETEKTVTVKLNDYTGTAVSSINLSIRMTSTTDGIIENGQQDVTFAVKTLQATSTPQQPSTGGESGGGSMAWILMFIAPLLYIRRKYSV